MDWTGIYSVKERLTQEGAVWLWGKNWNIIVDQPILTGILGFPGMEMVSIPLEVGGGRGGRQGLNR